MWGRHWLETLLAPNSDLIIPRFPRSSYLSLPLLSVLNKAREHGMQYSTTSDDPYICVVCLERPCNVAAEGCGHELCVKCALYLCSTSNIPTKTTGPSGSVPCPLCRHGIISFIKLPGSSPTKDPKLSMSLSLCILHPHDENQPPCVPDIRKNQVASVSTDYLYPVTYSPLDDPPVPWTRPKLPLTRSQTKSFMERLNTYMAAWSKDRHEEDADRITRSGYTLLTTRAPPRPLGQMPTLEPECPEQLSAPSAQDIRVLRGLRPAQDSPSSQRPTLAPATRGNDQGMEEMIKSLERDRPGRSSTNPGYRAASASDPTEPLSWSPVHSPALAPDAAANSKPDTKGSTDFPNPDRA